MLWLVIGGAVLFALLGGLRAFERASITSIKTLFLWIAALGGLSLALLLVLTGREGVALGALAMFGPMLWQQFQAGRRHRVGGGGTGPRAQTAGRARSGPMTREEAHEILGLKPGASTKEIREAHLRLMRGAHPDVGGSDWIAARINQARDILLG